jgi:hypothetical protein
MEPKVLRSGTYTRPDGDDSLRFKTRYFSDGSAIIVTERGILLLERRAEYEVKLSGLEPR